MGYNRLTSAFAVFGTVGIMLLASACGTTSGSSGTALGTPTATPTPSPSVSTPAPDNGIATKSPKAILAAVADAVRHSTSVHMHGILPENGRKGRFDLHVGTAGAQGSMSVPAKGTMANVDIITVQGKTYIKGSELWQAVGGQTMTQLIGDRWVIMPASQAASFDSLTTFSGIAAGVLKPTGTVTRGKRSTIAGQPVIALKDSDGSIMYAATTGEPVVVRLVPPPAKAKSGEYLSFTEWNTPLTVTAPPNAIDFSKIKHP